MTLGIAVVCEASADFEIASDLADRVVCDRVDWIEPGHLPHLRTWRGADDLTAYFTWSGTKRLAQQFNVRAHGHFGDQPGEPDAAAARRALLLVERIVGNMLSAIILVRDVDKDDRRRVGLEQARQHSHWKDHIVIGLANRMRESWVLSGYEPQTSHESELLTNVTRELDFNPRLEPERLTSDQPHERLSPKRVVAKLTSSDHDREAACWRDASLEMLRTRGAKNGLAEYLDEICDRLVPLFIRPDADPTP